MKFDEFNLFQESYQTLLTQQTEQHGVAHFPQVLKTNRLELSILDYVFQLMVKEFQDSWQNKQNSVTPPSSLTPGTHNDIVTAGVTAQLIFLNA